MATKRKKPLNVFPVKNLEDANKVLARIAHHQREVAAIEADMNKHIDRIKADAKTKAAGHEEKIQGFENGLQAFSEYRKDELFQKARSIPLNFGNIGFRKSTSLKPAVKHTWAMVLGIIKDKGFKTAVRRKESVNKDVLGEWPDDRLEQVSVRRVSTDQFWYEINEEELEAGN